MKNIIYKIIPEDEKNKHDNAQKEIQIISYFSGIFEINILNNPVDIPFYYLYRNKKTKDIKIFMKYNGEIKIFKYQDEKEIIGDDYITELKDLMDITKFQESNLIMLCFICEEEKKRDIKKKNDEIYEYKY